MHEFCMSKVNGSQILGLLHPDVHGIKNIDGQGCVEI